MSSVWLNVFFMCVCVDVRVQCLVERVSSCVFVWMFVSSVWLNVFLHVCLCGCSCPVFG